MNLNKKITKFTGDGIPAYNAKINELIDAANWLLGIRTINGKMVSESDQGPVIDLSQASSTQPSGPDPTATDPDGYAAGWRKITLIDTSAGNFFDLWAWTGNLISNTRPVPWWTDPSGVGANWIVCIDNTFWGTGHCPTGTTCVNFTNPNVSNTGTGSNPFVQTCSIPTPPIKPPTACTPRFFMQAFQNPNQGFNGPCLPIGAPATCSFNYTVTVAYDGTTVFNVSASGNCVALSGGGFGAFLAMPESGWLFDPGGLPGYAQGSKYWVWQFNGTASTNTNPQIVFTFSHNAPVTLSISLPWGFVFMQGS